MEPHELIHVESNVDFNARLMITHLHGAGDVGGAGAMALEQLLAALPSQRVAVFDTDMLIDYRSHRPLVTINEWRAEDVDIPQIAIDLVHDDAGQPILVLHGPEPDAKWQRFSECLLEFAQEAGVETLLTMKGVPAAVPHTRPPLVHVQTSHNTEPDAQPAMGTQITLPSSADSFIQYWLGQSGIAGYSLLATVPFYLAGAQWPHASLALLKDMSHRFSLSLPTGNLEAAVQDTQVRVEESFNENEDSRDLITSLEQRFDEHFEMLSQPHLEISNPADGDPFADATWSVPVDGSEEIPSFDADELASTIEAFLERAEENDNPYYLQPDNDAERRSLDGDRRSARTQGNSAADFTGSSDSVVELGDTEDGRTVPAPPRPAAAGHGDSDAGAAAEADAIGNEPLQHQRDPRARGTDGNYQGHGSKRAQGQRPQARHRAPEKIRRVFEFFRRPWN